MRASYFSLALAIIFAISYAPIAEAAPGKQDTKGLLNHVLDNLYKTLDLDSATENGKQLCDKVVKELNNLYENVVEEWKEDYDRMVNKLKEYREQVVDELQKICDELAKKLKKIEPKLKKTLKKSKKHNRKDRSLEIF